MDSALERIQHMNMHIITKNHGFKCYKTMLVHWKKETQARFFGILYQIYKNRGVYYHGFEKFRVAKLSAASNQSNIRQLYGFRPPETYKQTVGMTIDGG